MSASGPVICRCLIAVALLISCKRAEMANIVIARATSPDEKWSALLIDRYYHAALISDGFFLIVIRRGDNADAAVNARHIDDSSLLIATRASKVQLRWQGNDALLVICDSCGLEAIDIVKKLDHFGSIKIIYQGFPQHAADSQEGKGVPHPVLLREKAGGVLEGERGSGVAG
jgi:hypothetical protein